MTGPFSATLYVRFGMTRVARSNRPGSRGARQYAHSHSDNFIFTLPPMNSHDRKLRSNDLILVVTMLQHFIRDSGAVGS